MPPLIGGGPVPADLTVVICSLNGAPGVDRCLAALANQTVAERLQVVVVDDGSDDDTSEVAARHGAVVVRHEFNRGLAAARNSGTEVAVAEIIAFLDDDCVPAATWAAELLAGYAEPAVIAVGGPIKVTGPDCYVVRYLRRHNPLLPLELDLGESSSLLYRLRLYLRRQWQGPAAHDGARDVFSLVGANMSFRASALAGINGFDPRFTFGAEELEVCLRLRDALPDARLRYLPSAVVEHRYEPRLGDTLRRARAYGIGNARLHQVRPAVPFTLFPLPVMVAVLALLGVARRRASWLAAAAALPWIAFPAGVRTAGIERQLESLLDPAVQMLQEAYGDVGVVQGAWRYRGLPAVPDTSGLSQQPPVRATERIAS